MKKKPKECFLFDFNWLNVCTGGRFYAPFFIPKMWTLKYNYSLMPYNTIMIIFVKEYYP